MLCFTLLLFLCVSNSINYVNAKNLQTSDKLKNIDISQKFLGLDNKLKHLVNHISKKLLPYAMEVNEYLNLSLSCKKNAFQLFLGVRNLQISALKILDAVGKVPEGLLSGNVHILGDYEECMTTSLSLKYGRTAFKGKYCMLNVRPSFPIDNRRFTLTHGFEDLVEATKNSSELTQFLASFIHIVYSYPIKFGLCIPSGCRSKDVSTVLDHFAVSLSLNVTVLYCDQQDNPSVMVGRKIALIVLSIDALLVLIGSSMDCYSQKKGIDFKSTGARLVLCFSIFSNIPKVMSTKTSSKSLNSVFGVRCLSLFYVVLLYECNYHYRFLIQGHAIHLIDEISNYLAQIILNGFLTVEVFFFLGGLLNCYCRMKEKCSETLSPFQIIIHRLWRIYPAYLFSMVEAYLLAYSRGPMATFAKEEFWSNCKTQWWKNILFINNFYPFADMCMMHTCYIAADMHLFLISQFTLPVLSRSAKKGIILHLAILVAGLSATVIWAWHKSIMPSIIIYEIDWSGQYKLWSLYLTTLPHIAPYFAGIIIGYILHAWKDIKISLVCQIIGWSLAAFCSISTLLITKIWNAGVEYTVLESAFYFGFSRLVYVAAVAWLVVCCVKGYGGIINYILSLKVWIPISKISYMMFLTFPILQAFHFANLRMIIDSSLMTVAWRYMGTLVISILIASAMVLMVESPFIAMENILFKSTTGKRSENNVETGHKRPSNGNIHI